MASLFAPRSLLSFSLLLTCAACGGPATVVATDGGASDGGAVDAVVLGEVDAADDDAGTDAAVPTSCREGTFAVAHDDEGLEAFGLAPLGEGWAMAVRTDAGNFLQRLDDGGAAIGEPISLGDDTSYWGRGAIGVRALGEGVVVRAAGRVRFVRADGSEPFAPLEGLDGLVLGPSTGDAVMGIHGDDVVRITRSGTALAIERFASGIDLSGHDEPTAGYVTGASMGVSSDGCLALGALSFDYAMPGTLRTIPIVPGAACADATLPWTGMGSIGVYDTLADGRFVTVGGMFVDGVVGRSHLAQLATLGGSTLVTEGETFGTPLYYGVRAAIASSPSRTVLATQHGDASASPVSFWRWSSGTPEEIDADGASYRSGVYLAWHPLHERFAAIYGLDAREHDAEQTIGMRCDL